MKIKKLKWGFYSIINENGREVAVTNSYSEAKRYVKRRGK